ncbi:MBL fold metallo-hydrolase [bacterium]|nr:MBL fold metallo-hydrolase [bacterium]
MLLKTYIEGPIDANNYLLIDDDSKEAVLIDCSAARPELINEIKNLGVKLKYILLTHGHFDHILGVDKFSEEFSVDAFVAEDDLAQVKATPEMIKMFTGLAVDAVKNVSNFVKDGDEFFIGNLKIKAIATPGHTEGGMCYLVEDKLFSGDTLFQRSIGRTDFPGGNFGKISHSIKEILFKLPEETEVYPGHGPKTTIGFEKKYNDILNM